MSEPLPDLEDAVDRCPLRAQVGKFYKMAAIARIPGDREFVVDHAHRDTLPAETPDNAEALIITASDNCSHSSFRRTDTARRYRLIENSTH